MIAAWRSGGLLCRLMYEYSSVSASSYDPGALVAKLNEAAADGWDVVSIVPTGGDVSAFLRRDLDAELDEAIAEEVALEDAIAEEEAIEEAEAELAAEDALVAEEMEEGRCGGGGADRRRRQLRWRPAPGPPTVPRRPHRPSRPAWSRSPRWPRSPSRSRRARRLGDGARRRGREPCGDGCATPRTLRPLRSRPPLRRPNRSPSLYRSHQPHRSRLRS